jgi:CheY-like chemotaxis protein
MPDSINILIADDNGELCVTIEQNVRNTLHKFKIDDQIKINIQKAFTEHAFDHGSNLVKNGFKPDICIFDLVFNGTTGIDLYRFITQYTSHRPQLCIYTGVEKTYIKRQEAEVVASESGGDVYIIAKPGIVAVLEWLEHVLERKFLYQRKFEKEDPFDML